VFFRGSRYEHVPDAEVADRVGRTIRYKRMRFIPAVEAMAAEAVRQGDRPDLVAYRTLGDPEQFWRLCDVNRTLRPADLTATPGTRIGVPGPGAPGTAR
jgi:hypothetical protein